MIALVQPEAKLGPAVREFWNTSREQGSEFYVSTGVIASVVRLTSDKRIWNAGPSSSESGAVVQILLQNSFFHVKHETSRTMSIFLNLVDKYSPHSQDVPVF